MCIFLSAAVIMALLFLNFACIDLNVLVSGCVEFWEIELFWSFLYDLPPVFCNIRGLW